MFDFKHKNRAKPLARVCTLNIFFRYKRHFEISFFSIFEGYLGPRTNDSNYYYLKHPKFAMSWPTKYIEVYMVYNNGVVS